MKIIGAMLRSTEESGIIFNRPWGGIMGGGFEKLTISDSGEEGVG